MKLIELTAIKTDDPGFNLARDEYNAARMAHAGAIARDCMESTPQTQQDIEDARLRSLQAAVMLQDARYRLAAGIIHDIGGIVPGSLMEFPADDY